MRQEVFNQRIYCYSCKISAFWKVANVNVLRSTACLGGITDAISVLGAESPHERFTASSLSLSYAT